MDYNSLIEQIKAYTKRNDDFFVNQIPNLIDQAVNRIYSEAKSIGFEKVIRGDIEAVATLDKPADWKETISITLLDDRLITPKNILLEPRSLEFCLTYWDTPAETDTPKYYANYLAYNSFYFAPTPDYQYQFELIYRALPLFNKANPRNFLTDRYPSLLLYACLVETAPFLKNDQRIQVFDALYKRNLENTNMDSQKMFTDRTTKRNQ